MAVMLIGVCGRMVAVGDEIRLRREQKQRELRPAVTVLLVTLVVQLLAMGFYYQRYRQCDSLTGFAAFMVVSGVAGFVLTMHLSPVSPLLGAAQPVVQQP